MLGQALGLQRARGVEQLGWGSLPLRRERELNVLTAGNPLKVRLNAFEEPMVAKCGSSRVRPRRLAINGDRDTTNHAPQSKALCDKNTRRGRN